MFEINIHRETLAQKRKAHKRKIRVFFLRVIYIAVLALFTGVFTLHSLLLHKNISAKEEELSKVEEILAAYRPRNGEISLEKIQAVSQIKGGQPRWGKKLQALSSLLPPQMWLTQISLMNERIDGSPRDVFHISGSTYVREENSGLSTIVDFLHALRNDETFSKDFESIKLLSSKRSPSSDKEELDFKLICLIRR